MSLIRTSAPSDLITLAEGKRHLELEHTADYDTRITSLIAVVTDILDANTGEVGKALLTQTWEWKTFNVCGAVELPVKPVQSVSSITYYDADNQSQSLAVSDYEVYEGYIRPKMGKAWPSAYNRIDAFTLTFVAGYGDVSNVPDGIKQAGKLLLGHYFENVNETTSFKEMPIPRGVSDLISRHKIGWIGA